MRAVMGAFGPGCSAVRQGPPHRPGGGSVQSCDVRLCTRAVPLAFSTATAGDKARGAVIEDAHLGTRRQRADSRRTAWGQCCTGCDAECLRISAVPGL